MIIEKTNGKLYIAGEYQVLEKKGIAVITGIDRHINFEISANDKFSYQNEITKEYFHIEENEVIFDIENNNKIVKASFKVVFEYLKYKNIEITPFKLVLNTELENGDGKKYGFGSSSAVISGIIKVVTMYFELELTNEEIFKLAVFAQLEAGELTSGGDLAASIFGTTIYYQRYNLEWLLKQTNYTKLLNKKWPHLKLIPFKTDLKFAAVWTKKSYKTNGLKKEMTKELKLKAKNIVNKLFINLIDNNYQKVKSNIKDYQIWFDEYLEDENLITVEIKKTLEILNKFFLAGKISGAGGGDSVIFLYPNDYNFIELEKELKKNNLELILL